MSNKTINRKKTANRGRPPILGVDAVKMTFYLPKDCVEADLGSSEELNFNNISAYYRFMRNAFTKLILPNITIEDIKKFSK
jgi:hypothetical protein